MGTQSTKENKATKTLTVEEAISEIRKLRAGKLFVGNMEYIDHLLSGYDAAIAENAGMADYINKATDLVAQTRSEVRILNLRVDALEGEIEQVRTITTHHTTT